MGRWSQENTGVGGVPGPREGAASRAAPRGREGRCGARRARVHVASGEPDTARVGPRDSEEAEGRKA